MGDRDSIYGFAALGLDAFPVTDPVEAGTSSCAGWRRAIMRWSTSPRRSQPQLETEIDRYRARRLPAIIPIPGVSGNTGMGIRNVKKSVEQAVGSDIIFGGNSRTIGLAGRVETG